MEKKKLFEKLLGFYGGQNWWPVTSEGSLKPTYEPRKCLSEKQKFEISVGAILTQNTSWKNVEKAISNLHKAGLLSVKGICECPQKRLALLLKPSGYYNQKAKKVKFFASHLKKSYGGSIEKMLSLSLPQLRRELLSLHGIGPETADSIILYAGGKPVFVVDAYTKRIAERFYGKKFSSYVELQAFFEAGLEKDAELFSEFHALLVEHGKRFCTKAKPKCPECPINKNCWFHIQ
ncbi:MAG: hypothetical protein QXK06_03295 [Candidatus Diapherotrites archaeon]